MSKRLRLEEGGNQEHRGRPQPEAGVKIAVDLSRSKWVYCVRWEGAERLRLSTGSELEAGAARGLESSQRVDAADRAAGRGA